MELAVSMDKQSSFGVNGKSSKSSSLTRVSGQFSLFGTSDTFIASDSGESSKLEFQ